MQKKPSWSILQEVPVEPAVAQQSLAADGSIAFFSSNLFELSLNADG